MGKNIFDPFTEAVDKSNFLRLMRFAFQTTSCNQHSIRSAKNCVQIVMFSMIVRMLFPHTSTHLFQGMVLSSIHVRALSLLSILRSLPQGIRFDCLDYEYSESTVGIT